MADYPHMMIPPWEGGPCCRHCHRGPSSPGFDPNGECEAHRQDAETGLKIRTAAEADRSKYIHAFGLEAINARAAVGYRVVAAWNFGAETTALMERIE